MATGAGKRRGPALRSGPAGRPSSNLSAPFTPAARPRVKLIVGSDSIRRNYLLGGQMKILLTLIVGMLMLQTAVVRGDEVTLTGAGATFPKPLYEKWAAEYTKAHPDVRINYQGIGSGGGIKSISDKSLDCGATDGP